MNEENGKAPPARKVVREMAAYHVTAHPAAVILDANESPYPAPPKLQEKIAVLMAGSLLNRYPDMEADFLRTLGARKEGVEKKELLFGNGSDDLIQIILGAYVEPGDAVLVPAPTFVMYAQAARFFSASVEMVALPDDFRYDAGPFLAAVEKIKPKIIFLARPNNPTGGIMKRDDLLKLAAATPGLLVVDEAYIDYCSEGPVGPLFQSYPNVIIMRTLSKVGFAALRLGYVMAQAGVIEELNKVRQPYNVNSLTQVCGAEIFRNWNLLLPTFEIIMKEREAMAAALEKIKGVVVFPSEANFLLFRVAGDPAPVFSDLLAHGVRVRWFENDTRLGACFRVTIGTPEENSQFIGALAAALS